MFERIKRWVLERLMPVIKEEEDYDCEDLENWDEEENNEQIVSNPPVTLADNEFIGNWTPPARYCVRTGNIDLWCDQVKSGHMSIDLYYTLKIRGVDQAVCASLSETSYIIFDYKPTPATNAFDRTPKTNIDSMTQVKQEANDQEDAEIKIDKGRTISQDTGVVSAYA